ncbi:hypothetical protein ACFJGV_00740 [Cnuibacter sp. UC19_7]|uniref:hypothetical protein n=1 Tax=Cnuibacter sp. UC19_7 TaxID=3350166 RepID=UPI0036708707
MSQNQYAPMPPASPAPGGAVAGDPGRTLSIVGFILAFVIPLVGLILSIVAMNQSKRAGYRNALARWGIIVSIIVMVLGLIIGIVSAIAGVLSASVSYGY